MSIQAKRLRNMLQDVIDRLDELDEDANVKMVSNTYFLGNPRLFLGIAGYDGGYVNLDEFKEEGEDE